MSGIREREQKKQPDQMLRTSTTTDTEGEKWERGIYRIVLKKNYVQNPETGVLFPDVPIIYTAVKHLLGKYAISKD